MSKIYVHIGLPKTATTTLQSQFYPRLPVKKVDYLGVYQPRGSKKSTFFDCFIQAVNEGDVEKVRRKIEKKLEDKRSLLISEELIVVSEPQIDWRGKLKNLSEILSGFDYHIIVTVREPVSAMYSFYVELYSFFEKTKMSFTDIVTNHPSMEIYHYNKLFNHLFSFFDSDRVYVVKFEDIIKGNIDSLQDLIVPQSEVNYRLGGVKVTNFKKSNHKYVFTGNNITSMDLVRKSFKVIGLQDNNLLRKTKGAFSPIIKLFDSITVKEIRVQKPLMEEIEDLRKSLKSEIIFLKERYGIDYL